MSWGVDLGVRSVYAAHLDGSTLQLYSFVLKRGLSRALELNLIAEWIDKTIDTAEAVYIEEPPLAGSRNVRVALQLAMTAGTIASRIPHAEFIPVATWKKKVVGKGNVDKTGVSQWLNMSYPDYFVSCAGDQNHIDATCIAFFGN
jgi:hypothetical protein